MRKTIIALFATLLLGGGIARATHLWEDPNAWWDSHWCPPPDAPKYTGDELSLDLFGSYLNPEEKFEDLFQSNIHHGSWGGGAGLNYFFINYLGIGCDVNLSDHSGRIVDQVMGNAIVRVPIGNTGLAPYAIGGAGRGIWPSWEWVYDGGVGLEFRFTPGTGIFSDARYMWPDHSPDRLLIRAGLRFSF